MFDKTNNSSQNNPNFSDNKMNFDQQRDFKIEDFPIHTMKKDLENINNPDYFSNANTEVPMKPVISQNILNTSGNESISQKNSSPFLNDSEKEDRAREVFLKEAPKEHLDHPGIGKAVIIAIVAFIILVTAAGGYYFWMTRMGEEVITESPVEPILEPPIISEPPVIPPTPTFSKNSPNYLSFDIANADIQIVENTVADYANKVSQAGEIGAFEFLVTDINNNPVTFSDFSQKIGINLPQNILSNLGSDFSLFIYNYGNKTRYGLGISSNNEIQIKTALLAEEKMLPQYLSPIFGLQKITSMPEIVFNDTTYKGIQIRYVNISVPEDLALDYSIYNGKLVIATTKASMYAVLDYMQTPLLIE